MCYQRGDFAIEPQLERGRRTLFPDAHGGSQAAGWAERRGDPHPPAGRRVSKRRNLQAWRRLVTYRGIPLFVQGSIRELHLEKQAPMGEIVTRLFQHALDAFRSGRLLLHPQPRARGQEIS